MPELMLVPVPVPVLVLVLVLRSGWMMLAATRLRLPPPAALPLCPSCRAGTFAAGVRAGGEPVRTLGGSKMIGSTNMESCPPPLIPTSSVIAMPLAPWPLRVPASSARASSVSAFICDVISGHDVVSGHDVFSGRDVVSRSHPPIQWTAVHPFVCNDDPLNAAGWVLTLRTLLADGCGGASLLLLLLLLLLSDRLLGFLTFNISKHTLSERLRLRAFACMHVVRGEVLAAGGVVAGWEAPTTHARTHCETRSYALPHLTCSPPSPAGGAAPAL
jgi:hypothetical protein